MKMRPDEGPRLPLARAKIDLQIGWLATCHKNGRLNLAACGGRRVTGVSALVRRIANTASLQYAYPEMAPAYWLFDGSQILQNRAKLINPHKAILLPNPRS